MALIKLKPTSPGTRFQVRPDRSHLHKGEPYARSWPATSPPAGATMSAA